MLVQTLGESPRYTRQKNDSEITCTFAGNKPMCKRTEQISSSSHASSVPPVSSTALIKRLLLYQNLPHFWPSVSIHNNTQTRLESHAWSILHINDISEHNVHVRGDVQLQNVCSTRQRIGTSVICTVKTDWEETCSIFEHQPPTYIHLTFTHVMNASSPSPFLPLFLLLCIIVHAGGKYKLGRS